MNQEIEVKFLNIDIEKMEKNLADIGAKRIGEFFQSWKSFDYPDWRLDAEGAWIRLRNEGDGRVALSYKKRLGIVSRSGEVNDSGMEEIEVVVNDFDKMSEILIKSGFIEKHYAEKKRIKWIKEDISFDIDIYPELEPILEIETNSWEKIDTAIELLGLDPEDKKIFSANQVYGQKGIKVPDVQSLTFENGVVYRNKQ